MQGGEEGGGARTKYQQGEFHNNACLTMHEQYVFTAMALPMMVGVVIMAVRMFVTCVTTA